MQRETFDEVAALYDEVRPLAPPVAIDALWRRLDLRAGDTVVEVGAGTGQLTIPLARRGARLLAIEPGASLAGLCARKAAETPGCDVRVIASIFEAWAAPGVQARAVVACQSAHWIEPEVFLDRSLPALERDGARPPGSLGLLWHLDRSAGTPFWAATQPLYDRYVPDAAKKPPQMLPIHVAQYEEALADDPRFERLAVERFPWTRVFDAPAYLRLLETHSPVRMLDEAERAAFLAGHAAIIGAMGGRVERRYETVLLAAHATALPPAARSDAGPA